MLPYRVGSGLSEFPYVGQPADAVAEEEDPGDDQTDLGVADLPVADPPPRHAPPHRL